MAIYAPGTGGTVAPVPSSAANTNQGSGTATNPKKKKAKRPHPPGKPFKWANGTYHTRRQGEQYRSNAENGGGNGGGNSPSPPKPSKHPLLDRANAEANIRYGGAEQSLDARGLAIPAWYQNYKNDVTAARTSAQQYAAPIQAQAQQRATDAGQAAPGLDPNTPAGHDAALAAAARNALGQAFVTTLQGIGQTNDTYLAGRQAVAATAEVGDQQQLAKDRTNLAKEKGEFVTTERANLKDKKRQEKLENIAYGIKATTAANSAADKAAQLNKYGYTDAEWAAKTDAQRNKIRNKTASGGGSHPDLGKINKYGYTDKQWRGFTVGKRQSIMKKFDADNKTPDKPAAQFTPAARHKTKADIRKGMGIIKQSFTDPKYNPKNFWGDSYNYLVRKGYDPLLARAIVQRMKHGRLNPKVQKRLKDNYGITLGSGKKVTLPNGPASVPVVGGIIGIGQTPTPGK